MHPLAWAVHGQANDPWPGVLLVLRQLSSSRLETQQDKHIDTQHIPALTITLNPHSVTGVKVGGRWRLVDPAAAALHGGGAEERPAAPFFTPPDAWAYMYHPLEAHWQLLPDPIPLSDWWGMPRLGAGFFARGMSLVAPQGLGATYTSPAPKEGAPLPVVELVLGCPLLPGGRLRHVLRDAANGRELCAWPATATATATTPRNAPGGSVSSTQGGRSSQQALTGLMGVGAAAYQQVELPVAGAGPGGPQSLGVSRFGAKSFAPVPHRLGATLPGPGTYDLEVQVRTLGMHTTVHCTILPVFLWFSLCEHQGSLAGCVSGGQPQPKALCLTQAGPAFLSGGMHNHL